MFPSYSFMLKDECLKDLKNKCRNEFAILKYLAQT